MIVQNMTPEEKALGSAIINTPDKKLQDVAEIQAYREFQQDPIHKKNKRFSTMLPVADSFIKGATTKGTLSTKTKSGANNLKDWGFFLAATKLYSAGVNAIVNKVPPVKEFAQEHPLGFSVANTGGALGTGYAGIHFGNKAFNKFIKPQLKKIETHFDNIVDNSKAGVKANGFINNIATKYPKQAKFAAKTAVIALPVLCVVKIVETFARVAQIKKDEKQNMQELKAMQANVATNMANELLSEQAS